MKILLYSIYGDAVALVKKLEEEGNEVDLFIFSLYAKATYEGLCNKVDKPDYHSYDIVIFDMVGKGMIADNLHSRSWGASRFMDSIELDRKVGIDFMKQCGIATPKTYYFKGVSNAISFIKKEKQLYVMKPLGNKDTSLTYVPKESNDEVIDCLERHKAEIESLLLQQKIEGIELSTEAWFHEGKLQQGSINNTLEDKKFLSGNLGVNVGCSTSMVWKSKNKVIESLVKKIEKHLPQDYSGPLDLNTIWQGDKPYGLEWSARMGYSAIYALMEIMDSKLINVIKGEKMSLNDNMGYSVRLSIPPYPLEILPKALEHKQYIKNKGIKIKFPDKDSYHVWLLDAMADEEENVVVAGVDGVVAEVTAMSRKPESHPKELVARLKRFSVPNLQWRSDLFTSQAERYQKLKVAGLL